jgi:cyanophycin synthetase
VVAGPGDRRDEDLIEIGQAAAAAQFDYYICRRDDDLRGRQPDEVPNRIREAMLAAGTPADRITIIPDEQEAMHAGLSMARRGDLVLLFADSLARSWKQVVHFRPEGTAPEAATPYSSGAHTSVAETPQSTLGASLTGELSLVRDERGVRLARESDD